MPQHQKRERPLHSPHSEPTNPDAILKRARRHLRQIGRFIVVVALFVYCLHRLFPDFFTFSRDLAITVNILLIGLLIDLVLSIKQRLDEPPIQVHASEIEAYERLTELSRTRGVKNIDLVQFSGQTVMPFLQHLGGMAKAGHRITVRLFLLHPDQAKKFDTDGNENQVARIEATLGQIRVINKEAGNITIQPFFYKTSPGVSGAIIDGKIVSVGWYCSFPDGKDVMRVRSHDRPAITAINNDALATMLRQHVDALLSDAQDAKDWRISPMSLVAGA